MTQGNLIIDKIQLVELFPRFAEYSFITFVWIRGSIAPLCDYGVLSLTAFCIVSCEENNCP